MKIKGFKVWFFCDIKTTAIITTACSIENHNDFEEIQGELDKYKNPQDVISQLNQIKLKKYLKIRNSAKAKNGYASNHEIYDT